MIKKDLDKDLLKIIELTNQKGYNEIILEQDEPITILKYDRNNKKLIKSSLEEMKIKIDKNKIMKIHENIAGLKNKDEENYVNTFITPTSNILFRVYSFLNKDHRTINIKLLNLNIRKLSDYIKGLNISNEEKKKFYKDIVSPNINGLIFIASKTENLRKNFMYSIIEEANIKTVSKIVSYEKMIEAIIKNKNSIIFQNIYNDKIDEYIRFINPDLIFIEKEFDKDVLKKALKIANSNKKVFIFTNNTDFTEVMNNVRKFLENEILGYGTFDELFRYFINLDTNKNGESVIYSIYHSLDQKF